MRGVSWCWRRRVDAAAKEAWIARLEAAGCTSWIFIEKPGRVRLTLEAWSESRAAATVLARKFGGQVDSIKASEWLDTKPTPPTRIGRRLEIIHDDQRVRGKSEMPRLAIPHGVAFGSGEHGTTFMLLRALAELGDCSRRRVLDLGAGSGVLALAARVFGATKIVATDFDPDSVRTARQNEVLNFSRPLIRWQQADVLKLKPTPRYDLVLANLFSGILVEAAPRIAACVAAGGELWLSGVLATQQREVVAAYRKQGMKFLRANRRGKWVMLRLRAPRV